MSLSVSPRRTRTPSSFVSPCTIRQAILPTSRPLPSREPSIPVRPPHQTIASRITTSSPPISLRHLFDHRLSLVALFCAFAFRCCSPSFEPTHVVAIPLDTIPWSWSVAAEELRQQNPSPGTVASVCNGFVFLVPTQRTIFSLSPSPTDSDYLEANRICQFVNPSIADRSFQPWLTAHRDEVEDLVALPVFPDFYATNRYAVWSRLSACLNRLDETSSDFHLLGPVRFNTLHIHVVTRFVHLGTANIFRLVSCAADPVVDYNLHQSTPCFFDTPNWPCR